MEPLRQPEAFITPMSRIRSDIVRRTRKAATIGPVMMLRTLIVRMTRKSMLVNPLVNRPSLAKYEISNPKLAPKTTRKIVAAVAKVSPRTVNVVCLFRLVKSLSGKLI